MNRFALWSRPLLSGVRHQSSSTSSSAFQDAFSLLKADLKKAMLAKDTVKKDTIRGLMSSIKNKQIDNKHFDEFSLVDLYKKSIQQRQDSIAEYTKLKREELVTKEQKELDVIKEYLNKLPVSTQEELDAKLNGFLDSLQAESLQLKQIFGKIDWETAKSSYGASEASIRSTLVKLFKQRQAK